MVHADASNFAANVTKEEAYSQVLEQTKALFEGQRNWICNLANVSSLLWHAYKSLPAPSSQVNWSGFYVLDLLQPQTLILGPFHGKVACQTISFSRGVCGAAAREGVTQLVADVEKFPGHIACDSESRSEIVVPIFSDGGLKEEEEEEGKRRVVAIIDVDCAVVGGFDEVDREWLEKLAEVVGKGCDWGEVQWS